MPLKDSILPSTLGPVVILRLSFYSKAPSTSADLWFSVNIAKLVNFFRLIFDSVGFELQFGPKQKKIMIFCAERGCQIIQILLGQKSPGKMFVKGGGE